MTGTKVLYICLFIMILFLNPFYAKSTDEYAEKTGLSCEHCHIGSSGGGDLTEAGEEYLE